MTWACWWREGGGRGRARRREGDGPVRAAAAAGGEMRQHARAVWDPVAATSPPHCHSDMLYLALRWAADALLPPSLNGWVRGFDLVPGVEPGLPCPSARRQPRTLAWARHTRARREGAAALSVARDARVWRAAISATFLDVGGIYTPDQDCFCYNCMPISIDRRADMVDCCTARSSAQRGVLSGGESLSAP